MRQTTYRQADNTNPFTPELIQRAQAGDDEAFTELYRLSSPTIFRTIRSMVRDETLAQDIQQNTYLRALRGLKNLEKAESFLPWLRRIAVNETASELARKSPIRFSELADEEDELPDIPDTREATQPELQMDQKERARLVRKILSRLPAAQQLVLGMYYYEELSTGEIAEMLQISQKTVTSQLSRGRKCVALEVRSLERQGIQLYGLSPMGFLLALLRNQEPAKAAEKKAAQAILAKAVATEPVVLTARAAGSGLLHTALGRLAAGALALAVAAGGVMGYRALRDRLGPSVGDFRPTESASTVAPVLRGSTEPTGADAAQLPIVSTGEASPQDIPVSEPSEPESTEPKASEPAPSEPKPTEPEPSKSETPSEYSLDASPLPGQADPARPDEPVFVESEALRRWLIDEDARLSSLQSTGFADYLRASLRASAGVEADGSCLVTAELWKTVLFSQADYENWTAGGTLVLDRAAGYSANAPDGSYDFHMASSASGSDGYGYFTTRDSEMPLTVHRVRDQYLVSYDVGGGSPLREYVGSYCFYLPNDARCIHADQAWEGSLQEYLAMHRGEIYYDAAEDAICLRSDGK